MRYNGKAPVMEHTTPARGLDTRDSTLLDPEFDDDDTSPDEYESMKFYSEPGEQSRSAMSTQITSRRKRRTVRTDEPEVVALPEEPPEGWAEP